MFDKRTGAFALVSVLALGMIAPALLRAQAGGRGQVNNAQIPAIDSLVALALEVNPDVHAATRRIEAARARIGPAGALPDPMLGAGIMNFPVSEPGFGDFMTMKTVAVAQTLPYPGKLSLARRAAELEVGAAEARSAATRLEVAAEVRHAYYELAFLDRALELARDNQTLLVILIQTTESRYAVGTGGQQDVLKARVEASRLAEEAVALAEARRAALARLNALLDQPSETPVESPRVPERIARAAVTSAPASIRFTSAALGARASDSPFPALDVMQQRAIENSPVLRAHEAEIAAQTTRIELARKAHLPDFDVSLRYGERTSRSDMMSFMVSVPIPLHRRDRQDQQVAEAAAELAAREAEHHAMVNQLRADVAQRYAHLERTRAQLALFVQSIVPQGRAALESATAAFQVGRADFMTVVENQATLYGYETAYFRALTDFAKALAELERIVGAEVIR
ncbi:MAG: TolC family protein [Gemmatimonadota bacterium]